MFAKNMFYNIKTCISFFIFSRNTVFCNPYITNIFSNSAKRIYPFEIKRVRRITSFSGNELATVPIAVVCIGCIDTEGKCHDHRLGIRCRIITVGQPHTLFNIVRLQHFAFVHGSDSSTECRGDYVEQSYQFHFAHPNICGIGRHGNPAVLVHRDYCPFHIPATLMLPKVWFSWLPKAVKSLPSFCVVIFA